MNLDPLDRIQRVEPPPYLLTRIQQKIESAKAEKLPLFQSIAIQLGIALLLIINTIAIVNYLPKQDATQSFTQSMHITTDNTLYR